MAMRLLGILHAPSRLMVKHSERLHLLLRDGKLTAELREVAIIGITQTAILRFKKGGMANTI